MRKTITALILAGVLGMIPVTAHAATRTATPAHAHATNWTQQTTSAFIAWEHYRATAQLERLVTDSFHVKDATLRGDVAQLWLNAVKHRDVDVPTQYVADDLGLGGM